MCPQSRPIHLRLCHLPQTVHLHAQLSWITAIIRLCYSIRQLQLSKYTCQWENWIIGWSMSYPGMIGGAVVISTSDNRATSSWPLYITSNNKLCLGIQNRWRTKSFIFVHFVYGVQTRCTMALLLAVISGERRHCRPSNSSSQPREKRLEPVQNAKSDLIWCNLYMQE